MIETNTKIIEFLAGNCIGLGMIYGVLKIIARSTKNVVDDKLVTLFGRWLRRSPKPPKVNPK